MFVNQVKHALKEGRVQLGCAFAQIRSGEVVRILKAAGFDWAFLDAEHGGFGIETLQDLCREAAHVGLAPIVRVADLEYGRVARALDCGAWGILLPRVETPDLLDRAVQWTKFPPVGVRGFGLSPASIGYEKASIAQIRDHMNGNVMVVLQIETD